MKKFKTKQYICLKPECTTDGIWGYACQGYEIDGDDIYLISGSKCIKHHISTLKEKYQKYIISIINENNQ